MNQFNDYIDKLKHINDEIDYLTKKSKDLSYNNFIIDGTLKRAFIRSLEVIGEAVKSITQEVREDYSSIE